MISKEYVKNLLLEMQTSENQNNCDYYLEKLKIMSDDTFNAFIEENKITEENIFDYLKNKLKPPESFKKLNDLIS